MYNWVDFDADEVLEKAIEKYEEESGEALYAGDERRMLLNSFMYIAEVLSGEMNYRVNNNLIAYCDEETLMVKGAGRMVERNPEKYASVTMVFSMDSEIEEDVTIPAGSRVTAEGELFFELRDALTIPAGSKTATAECYAVEGGKEYNNIPIGKISILADTVPYITSVSNSTESSGGRDVEDLELYRKRVLEAPKAYSTTGCGDSYIQKAKEVDSTIADVKISNDEADIYIYILCQDGVLPGEDVLGAVEEHLSLPGIKALNDRLHILSAQAKDYEIDLSYKIAEKDYNRITEIQSLVMDAINQFQADMASEMQLDVNPELLRKYLYNAGAASITINAPTFSKTSLNEVALCTSVTANYAGTV